jgi:hypothetical protein
VSRYVFHSAWHLAAEPDEVYRVLADVESYPSWWREVRSGRRLDERSGEVVCRSVLPYSLRMVLIHELADPVTRVLQAQLTGDLVGTSRWTVRAHGDGTVATFEEDVTLERELLRLVEPLGRPILRLNHHLMMRSGERGLRRHLRAE